MPEGVRKEGVVSYFEDYVEDGLCCAMCGEFMGGSELGFVRYCSSCERSLKDEDRHSPRVPAYRPPPRSKSKAKGDKVPCPQCQRLVSPVGLKHHQIDKHGGDQ
jgi:hypothetical protein